MFTKLHPQDLWQQWATQAMKGWVFEMTFLLAIIKYSSHDFPKSVITGWSS